MAEKKVFLFRSMASVIDQALLSGLNLLIGLALIRYASKETYGLYTQLFAAGLLTTIILDSLIGSALTTLSARLPADERGRFVARAAKIHWVASALLAIPAGLVVGVLAKLLDFPVSPVVLGLSFSSFVFAQASREYCRTALFIESQAVAVAKMDMVFVLVTIAGAAAFFMVGDIGTPHIFFLLTIANVVASAAFSSTLWRSTGCDIKWGQYLADVNVLWSLSRWAVMGSVVGWLGNNSYLYFSGAIAGVVALADLNAARLLLMPIVIVGMAWTTLARPAMGEMIANSKIRKLRQFVLKSTLAMESFNLIYLGGLFVVYPWLIAHLFGEKYGDISNLILLWACYFAVNTARNVSTILLITYGIFRELFWQSVLSLIILVTLILTLTPLFGVTGALTAMILAELWQLAVNYGFMLPRARRQHLAPK